MSDQVDAMVYALKAAAPKCKGCGRGLIIRTIEEFEGLCRRDPDTELVPLAASRGCYASFADFVFRKAARLRLVDTSMNGALPMRRYRIDIGESFHHLVGIDFAEPTAQVLLDEWLETRRAPVAEEGTEAELNRQLLLGEWPKK